MKYATVILDRDSIVGRANPERGEPGPDRELMPDILEALVQLKHAGLRLVMTDHGERAANHEALDYDALFSDHDRLTQQLGEVGVRLDGIFFCPHSQGEQCDCRAPGAGLLRNILQRWSLEPEQCVLIAASPHSADAANAVRVPVIAVRDILPSDPSAAGHSNVTVVADLTKATDFVLTD